jgi:hypothetical protein
VFPFPARRALQEVSGARFQAQGNAPPLSLIDRFPEPKIARRRQG